MVVAISLYAMILRKDLMIYSLPVLFFVLFVFRWRSAHTPVPILRPQWLIELIQLWLSVP